jgi:hypothetical protein
MRLGIAVRPLPACRTNATANVAFCRPALKGNSSPRRHSLIINIFDTSKALDKRLKPAECGFFCVYTGRFRNRAKIS